MKTSQLILQALQKHANPAKAAHLQRFFKTGKGEYAEGDLFWGLTAPQMREIAKKFYTQATFDDLHELLQHPYHDARSAAFVMLSLQFAKAKKDPAAQKAIFEFYIAHLPCANNWDLVDISAPKISGPYLHGKDQAVLYALARSKNLWEQRVSMVSTWYLIRQGDFTAALALAEHFLSHTHDLMHKASGWMLREVGKKDERALTGFLDKFSKKMPRTMLRYSIEKLTPAQKAHYMKKD